MGDQVVHSSWLEVGKLAGSMIFFFFKVGILIYLSSAETSRWPSKGKRRSHSHLQLARIVKTLNAAASLEMFQSAEVKLEFSTVHGQRGRDHGQEQRTGSCYWCGKDVCHCRCSGERVTAHSQVQTHSSPWSESHTVHGKSRLTRL